MGFFLAGGLWATPTSTAGEALMLKDVQPLGADLCRTQVGRTEGHPEAGPGPPRPSPAFFLFPKSVKTRSPSG